MEQENTAQTISITGLDPIDISQIKPLDLSWLNNSMDNSNQLDTIQLDSSIFQQMPISMPLPGATGGGGTFVNTNTGANTGGSFHFPNIGINNSWLNNTNNILSVDGDANINGDVIVKGKSILNSLEKIEEKLAILRPNPELEEKWERLRQLRQEYIEVEKDIIEKEKLWDILKK